MLRTRIKKGLAGLLLLLAVATWTTPAQSAIGDLFAVRGAAAVDVFRILKAGHVVPGTTASYDLGSSTQKWRNVYVSGTITAGAQSQGGNLTATPDNTYDIGASGATRFRDLWLGRNASIIGTLTVTGASALNGGLTVAGGTTAVAALTATTMQAGGNLTASPDNTYDIGASGATRFRDLWLGRNASVTGTMGVTGATTLSSLATSGKVSETGGHALNRTAVAAATYTVLATDCYIGVNRNGTVGLTLPTSASEGTGTILIIHDEGGNAALNTITVTPNGAETIDGAATKTITSNFGTLRLITNGSNWFTW
jgi:hypothetical protein